MMCSVAKRVPALIVAPSGRLRDSLRVLLRACETITVVGLAGDGEDGLRQIEQKAPALVLLDGSLVADGDGETLRQIKERKPEIHCLVLVHSVEDERLALAAGADAVLQAGFRAEALFETIRSLTGVRP
jgi:DNA-binding NarL/FixJ family response regulator